MENSHTSTGYIIAIIAVLGSAWLMPPFPVFILSIGPLCLIGLILFIVVRTLRARQRHTAAERQSRFYDAGKEKAA